MAQAEDTPLMRQWRDVKSRHPDALVFFRVGDFYELFYEDAQEGARLLGLTLTSRNNGAASRVPLAGVPVRALDEYLVRLVAEGRRVAICDQVEDASEAKGIVRREVVETVTPGTALHDGLLSARRNNHLVALCEVEGDWGLAAIDLSTGELSAQLVAVQELVDELGRLEPSELLLPRTLEHANAVPLPASGGPLRTYRDDWLFDPQTAGEELLRRYGVQSLDAFDFREDEGPLIRATGALLGYLDEIRPGGVAHLGRPRVERSGSVMSLDEMTRRNLELVEPLGPGGDGTTLLDVLDRTSTAMGARLLRRWILRPLIEAPQIWRRQHAVRELAETPELRGEVRSGLSGIADLERMAGKLGTTRVTPRDLVGLARSLSRLPALLATASKSTAPLLIELASGIDLLDDVCNLLENAISIDAPSNLHEGGVIRRGYSSELDALRDTRDGARDFIARLQVSERKRTGIASLKIGFNKVFGYYFEVTRANLHRVPDDYHRKQTLANSERYFTPELKEWEERVMSAEDRIAAVESRLFAEVRSEASAQVGRLRDTAARLSRLDVLATLAQAGVQGRYTCPEVHTGFDVHIRAGRHPVVETTMPRESFIPNDVVLDENARILILTGPNMAGKSTVLRQIGLIQLLAQIGSFVPADAARLPVVDRIFTRVGASDNLARGQSTFMVEMNETAAIVHGATERSMLLLDEIGRGTSTYDGVSIAWAVTEYLHERICAKTIFATHYHELTQLGDLLPAVRNVNVAVREVGDDIVFLRRLEEGGADRSYGIQVARLAGLPDELIQRARELLAELEGTHSGGGEGLGRSGKHRPASEPPPDPLSFFGRRSPVVSRLRSLDLQRTTPLEALNVLFELHEMVADDDE